MAQRLLNVRVRPPRVTVLIDRDAKTSDLLLAFEFFSKIWGGRFGLILPVDPKACDALTEFRLAGSRPEFIYGVGLDDDHWQLATRRACQPRQYKKLSSDFINSIERAHFEDFYLAVHALIHQSQNRYKNKGQHRLLRFVTPTETSELSVYCAATFGTHHQNLREDLYERDIPFTGTTTTAFVELATEFVNDWHQSWLDVTGYELHPRLIGLFAFFSG